MKAKSAMLPPSPDNKDATRLHQRLLPPLWSNAAGNSMDLHGILNGCSVFLIAGGPSFKQVNLHSLNQPGILTMGLNNSPKTFRPDLWISVDKPSHFLQSIWLDPKIMKFVRTEHRQEHLLESDARIQSDTTVAQCPNLVFYESNLKFKANAFLKQNSVNWGNPDSEGGGRSVLLAALKTLYHLGARDVFLLGVDFEMSEESAYHFSQERSKSSIEGNRKTYQLLSDRFDKLQPLFEAADFHIRNCNPSSKLKSFPYLPFEAAVELASASMPSNLSEESSSDLYNRTPGRNDSGTVIAHQESKKTTPTIRRIDRHKRPRTIDSAKLPIAHTPPANSGILLFADEAQEWLIPWWFHHFSKSNPNTPVTLCDLGLSNRMRSWLLSKQIRIMPEPCRLPHFQHPWFYKPFLIANSPYQTTVFIDLDCEVRRDLSTMFSWAQKGLVLGNDLYPMGNHRKLFREKFYYNSGLLGVTEDNPVLEQWKQQSLHLHQVLRSDQEILNLTLYENESTVIELPKHFHQLRLDGEHAEATVMHWTGDHGKRHIRKQLQQLNF